MTTLARQHPYPLPANEAAAVAALHALFLERCAAPPLPGELQIESPLFDLVESAFQHWPTWEEVSGKPIVFDALLGRTDEDREHFLFKGMKILRAADA
jgi:hypothetical protein